MRKFLDTLYDRLYFLDEDTRKRVVSKYKKRLLNEMNDGTSYKEARRKIGSVEQIVKDVCDEYHLSYDYCVRNSDFDKDVIGLSMIIGNFIREVIKVCKTVSYRMNIESALESIIKIIVLLFCYAFLKIPFILIEEFSFFINRFIFYPYNATFDQVSSIVFSLLYLVICIILTLKVFGNYHIREKKEVDAKVINQVDKDYDWLDIMIRIIIYLLILVPLVILSVIDLVGILGTSYLVARGINFIGLPIMLAGLFGLLVSLIATIRDSLNHKRRSYLLAIIITIIVFVVGIIISAFNYNAMKKPANLSGSSIKPITETADIDLDAPETMIYVQSGTYDILLDPTLEDNRVRAEVTYYDDYVDVIYHQETRNDDNLLYFEIELEDNVDIKKKMENVVKDLKKGYIFDYSNTRKIRVKLYANEETKQTLEEMNK